MNLEGNTINAREREIHINNVVVFVCLILQWISSEKKVLEEKG